MCRKRGELMPRKSPEARAGASFRAGGKPPEPPDILSAEAAVLWREIAASRPPDYFDPAARVLLASFCEMAVTQQANFEAMRRDPLNPEWQTMAAKMQASLNSIAVKLRLTPSAALLASAGIVKERNVAQGEGDDSNVVLFGGPGVRF
jgi:phage terminase small subunit